MPRKKKEARELSTEEIMAKLFPKRVVTAVKEVAEKPSKTSTKDEDKG